ncbi:guanine nucleotide-binding protein G(o) subunit alpha [Nephila pilipes]|uniref:Guanine nucleotide-binding protein G(O) subunit alpha n=1 Tax=Nephila pilipes TaxID=299642 RepID=A0A8X6TGN9_NEPPI|nr:guanine nucleotide-binding protein G(o) subunit alpha [Nephila pilipes]
MANGSSKNGLLETLSYRQVAEKDPEGGHHRWEGDIVLASLNLNIINVHVHLTHFSNSSNDALSILPLLCHDVTSENYGARGSGKSTIMKQVKIIAEGFQESDYRYYKPVINSTIIKAIVAIVQAMTEMDIPFDNPQRNRDANIVIDILKSHMDEEEFSDDVEEAIQRLWKDSGVQKCFQRSNEYHISDNIRYFLDDIDRFAAKDFVLTENDILHTRIKTIGIVEENFNLKDLHFQIFDVCDKKARRLEWLENVEDVSAVIFCADISKFDQVPSKDEENKLKEALAIFDDICNNGWFGNAVFVLLLNKVDVFKEKIKKSSLKTCFPNYEGTNEFHDAVHFIQAQFESKNRNDKKEIHSYLTCTKDTSNTLFVFESVRRIIAFRNLRNFDLY